MQVNSVDRLDETLEQVEGLAPRRTLKPSFFHHSSPPINSFTRKPSLSRFSAPFVEALQPMPSQ